MSEFGDAFRRVQVALGLTHYAVTIRTDAAAENFADIDCDAEGCVATVRWNPDRCDLPSIREASATHEAVHLLLADLKHTLQHAPHLAAVEEERIARRLEPLLWRAVFGRQD